jgi:N-acetylglucosaminyl-diphospho-decaprenol L-rhamnosyltransferase
MSDRIGVVTVAYLSSGVIGGLLDSLPAATSRRLDVVVVDNSPEDDGLAGLLAARPATRLLEARDNPGYGTAANRGVAALDPQIAWVIVANPDLVIAPGGIDELLTAAARLERPGALGPLILDPDGTPYPSARKLPSLRTGVGHALFVRTWRANPWTRSYRNDAVVSERSTDWLSGAFLLLSRAAFEAVGGFDERYYMYFEDVDLGRRLGRAGWRNWYVPTAAVTHIGAMSTRNAPRAMIIAHHDSAYRFLASKYSAWYLWPVRTVLRAGLWLRSRVARG